MMKTATWFKIPISVLIGLFVGLTSGCISVATLNIDGNVVNTNKENQHHTGMDTTSNTSTTINATRPADEASDEHLTIRNHYACIDSTLRRSYRASNLIVDIDSLTGQCFGVWFETHDVMKTPIIEITARYTGNDTLSFVAGFTDTEQRPHYAPDKKIQLAGNQREYSTAQFDYSNPATNGYNDVDMSMAKSVLIFTNIEERKDLSGQLLIKKIVLKKP